MKAIGRYQIEGELGRGGMAVVYRAIDPHIGRTVALKLLPGEFSQDPEFRSRFQREVRTIGGLTSAAIVPLYDAGEHNGQPYLVMRLMTGGCLSNRLKQGPIPLPEALAMFNRIAFALDEAHNKGIIHRDLKPGNILLDEIGQPYLSDFGIVKLTEATSMTSRGTIGTPAYMSPEHFEGKVSFQSDIYALGIILFQMLTAKLPFRANTPPEWMKAHFMDAPPPICTFNPHLPSTIEPIVAKALAKRPEQRYRSAGEMAQVLQAIGSGDQRLASPSTFKNEPTVLATPSSREIHTSQPHLRPAKVGVLSPLWIGLGAIGLIIVILVGSLFGMLMTREPVTGKNIQNETLSANIPPPPTDTPILATDTPISLIATYISSTATSIPSTNTPIPPTATSIPSTNTPIPPTATSISPTNTPIPPTATSIPPTNTPTLISNNTFDDVFVPEGKTVLIIENLTPGDFIIDLIGPNAENTFNGQLVSLSAKHSFITDPGSYKFNGHSIDGQYNISQGDFNIGPNQWAEAIVYGNQHQLTIHEVGQAVETIEEIEPTTETMEADNTAFAPPAGQSRVYFQNSHSEEFVVDLGDGSGQIQVLPGVEDLYRDIAPGSYNPSITLPGAGTINVEFSVGPDQSWAILLDENLVVRNGQVYP